jgi:hypothetical protein
LGSSPFARHYSGSRGFFPFLRVLRCFSSPACLTLPYGFRQEYARITTRRFPHSEIPGSTDGQLLPGAYRSRPRPSSALGAKAFTVCPCSLDLKEHVLLPLWSFQGARELPSSVSRAPAHEKNQPHVAGLSKLNSVSRLESRRRGRRCSRRVGVSGRPEGHRRSRGVSRATMQQSRRLPE